MSRAIKITILCLVLCSAGLLIITRIRRRSFDRDTARINDDAKQWLHFWPGQFDWDVDVNGSRLQAVIPARVSAAESALSNTSSVLLTEAQAFDLTGNVRPQVSVTSRPYLLRAVVAAKYKHFPVQAHAHSQNTDIWMGSDAISRCDVPMRRQPMVAWLESAPREVFV